MKCLHIQTIVLFALSVVISAEPVITEFVASNDGSHLDEDLAASDWIEIRNSGATAVDLDGWKLTDSDASPSKWVFPSVTLQPGEYLVVFASGKNRTNPASELHTNFSLSMDGEYLALISPGGVATTEYSPAYPPQENGFSYGVSTPSNSITLVTENDPCKARVPDAAYNMLVGKTWRNNTPGFDESSWISGTQGVGYDYGSDINLDVESILRNINTSVYIRIPITTSIDPSNILSLTLRVKHEDGFAAFINGAAPANGSSYAPNPLAWNSTTEGGNSGEYSGSDFLDFDISDTIPSLVTGTNNMLAVHGLNASLTSSDYLFRCELVAQVAQPGSANTGYFTTPTPGTVNGSTAYEGILTDTNFNFGRGFYSAAFTETITCPDLGATIIYTTNGSVPSLSNGLQVPAADSNSAPVADVPITTTTVLRAIAVRTDYKSTNVDTQTYLFINDVLTQNGAGLPTPPNSTSTWDYEMDPDIVNDPRYSNLANDLQTLPILSIVIPNDDIWGSNGVLANPGQSGSAWERECSVEIINPDGSPGYQVNGGLRMHGSGSLNRAIGKKNMRIAFRNTYGSSRFKYPLWGPTGPPEIANLILRGSYFDSWGFQSDSGSIEKISRTSALQFRTHFATVAHARTGSLTIASNWVNVYINGQYWGPFNSHERPDAEFAELHNGGDETDYTVIKTRQEVVEGSRVAWDALITFCEGYTGSYDAVKHQVIMDQIELEQFIDYFFMNFWGANHDWPHNNWYVHKNDTLNGPFIFYVWDPEHYIWDGGDKSGVSNTDTPAIIYDRLRKSLEFQVSFGDRVHKHMFNDGVYTLPNILSLFQDIVDELEPAINCESARWGDSATPNSAYNTIDHWIPQVNYRKNTWIPERHTEVLGDFRNRGIYPNTAAPVFSQHGGTIISGYQLTMSNPDGVGTLYYTLDGSDPRQTGGAVSGSAQTYLSAVTINSGVLVKARVRNTNDEWSALNEATFTLGSTPTLSNIVVSEFNYHPADVTPAEESAGFTDRDDFEFIELMNTGATPIDLSHLAFDNNIEGIGFDFSTLTNTLLAPGARIVLAKNSAAYAARYGSSGGVAGNFSGRLSNNGETLTITESGSVLLSFTYNDAYPWPDSADGQGASLVLINPMSSPDHNQPASWRASGQLNGTPESGETLPTPPSSPLADSDRNGRVDLVDYVVQGRTQSGLTAVGLDDFLTIEFTIDPQAEGATTAVEYSDDLTGWTSATDKVEFVSEVYNADGTVTYLWRSLTPQAGAKQFMRVKVVER